MEKILRGANLTNKLAKMGVAAALILACTCIAVPIGAFGYVNLGDVAIFVCTYFLGWLAVPCAALGSAVADMIVPGGMIYAPATLLIKALMSVIVNLFLRFRRNTKSYCVAIGIASIVMVALYSAYSVLLVAFSLQEGDMSAAVFWVSFGLGFLQPLFCVPLSILLVQRLKNVNYFYDSSVKRL